MFADICHYDQGTQHSIPKLYAETVMNIVKQHIQETIMNIKTAKPKTIIGASLGLVGILVAASLLGNHPAPTAQAIQPGTWLKQVRTLSKGKKATCLATVQSASDAVKQDDSFMDFNGDKISNFETAAGGAIADVPAGTNYTLTINSYAAGTAKGTMIYEHGYGTYNYTIQKLSKHGDWKLVSIIACKQS